MYLEDYGWTEELATALPPGLEPGRVVVASGEQVRLVTERGDVRARVAGRLKHRAASSAELPAVGDWVALRDQRIEQVLPRRTELSRKVAGRRTDKQVVAANVDTVVVVMGLDGDFNPRRLERYLAIVWESGARPLVLLNKADIARDLDGQRAAVDAVALGVPVLVASCLDGSGVDAVRGRLRPRETAVLVGSSGVGKSTLLNRLMGERVRETRSVRAGDDRGRHTTTDRELFVTPGGTLLIDNPGIRELQLWAEEDALDRAFDDVSSLAEGCRYRDCAHDQEPGCAVTQAVAAGTLGPERLAAFHALQKELRYLHLRQDQSAQQIEKRKWRAIHREMRKSGKHRRT